jgi:predicted permease
VQVFLSLVLLIGAGLFVQSLRNLRNLDTGFETEQTLVFGLDPMRNGYTMERNRLFLRQLREKLATLPGAEGAGVALVRVLSGNEWDNSVTVQGYEAKPGENMNPFYNAVSQGYFQTLEIPMLEGRDFRDTDVDGAPKVGIVNQAFVKYYFGDQPAVGRRFGFGREVDIEIVGVIPDVRYQNMRQEIPRQVFVPYDQANGASEAHVYLRTRHEPDAMIAATREAVRGLDANIPLYALRPMQVQLEDSLVTERLIAFLAGAFGVVATLLSAIGLYGVLAYGVTRRTREIGLRMALGAQRGDVAGLVLKEMAWLFVAGAIVAIPVSYGLATVVRAQLYGIEPQDPFNIVAATLALAAVAVAAGCIPAWRASRIQPMQALRFE